MMKTVLYLSILAAFIAIGSGTGTAKKCYQCDYCNDVSDKNMTECAEAAETSCETSYWNETGVVSRGCTNSTANECSESTPANKTLTLCVCEADGCNNMTFPGPTTMATTTAGFERHCATATSTLIAVTVTSFFVSLF